MRILKYLCKWKSTCTTVVVIITVILFLSLSSTQASLSSGVIEWEGRMEHNQEGYAFWDKVLFQADGIQITGDKLQILDEENVAIFTGNVIFTSGSQSIHGEKITYNISEETSYILSPKGSMKTEQVEGDLFYQGEELTLESGRINLKTCTITTCVGDKPGYYFFANEIEIEPEKYITMTGVRFVESGITLFYWPKLTLPIDEKGIKKPPLLPMIGRSAELGWYVKYSHPFGSQTEAGGGYIDFRWAQKQGPGLGLTYVYLMNDNSYGKVSIFGVANMATRTLDHEYKLMGSYKHGNWDASWNAHVGFDGAITYRKMSAEANASISNYHPSGNFSFSFNGKKDVNAYTTNDSLVSSLALSKNLGSRGISTTLSGNFHYMKNNLRWYKLYNYAISLANKKTPITWEISANEQFNPDLIKENVTGTPSYYTVGRRPEIVIGAKPDLNLFGLSIPLGLELGYGIFHEKLKADEPPAVTPRSTGMIELRSKSVTLATGLTLRFGGHIRGYYYSAVPEGIFRNVRGLSGTLTYRPFNNLTLTNSYTYLTESTPPPVKSDKVTRQNSFRSTAQYRLGGHTLSVSSGYNFNTKRINNVTMSLQGKWDESFSYRLSSTYDIQKKKMSLLAATMELGGEGPFTFKLGGSYRFMQSPLNNIDASLVWKVAGWELSYGGRYLLDEKKFEKGIVSILRDLDCRKFGFTYDQKRKEFWLEYKITAFPDFGLQLGSQEDGLMFNLDGWQDLLGIEDSTQETEEQ